MADHADDALNEMMDTDELQMKLFGLPFDQLDDMERESLFDYDGTMFPFVFDNSRDLF